MNKKSIIIVFSLLVLASMLFTSCAPQAPQVVEKIVEVTSTPEGANTVFKSKDPTTYVYTSYGEPEMLDPALDYESAGMHVMNQVYETLVWYKRQSMSEIIPQLATEWKVSDDAKSYTFTIRKGVKFHNGDELTPDDVAWTFQRGLLQGSFFSAQLLMAEPIYGAGILDVTDVVKAKIAAAQPAPAATEAAPAAGATPAAAPEEPVDIADNPEALVKVDPAILAAVCEQTKAAIVADSGAGTVTFNLAQPWGPFLATLAHGVASIQDKKWAIEQGAWDGDCASWQKFYAKTAETTPLAKVMNGTGPYKFDHWTPGEEIVLTRNDAYWRTEPAWEGAPTGPAKIERVIIKTIDEWGTRLAMMEAGDADWSTVDLVNLPQADALVGEVCEYNPQTNDHDCKPSDTPSKPLKVYKNAPGVLATSAMFNFKINVEGGNNLVGSGKLDGNGIPPDFFTDIHVRKAFNYCFDWDTFIQEAVYGQGVQQVGVLIPGSIGYDPNGKKFNFDLAKCKSEIEAAWNGDVAKNGFRFQIAYNSGNMVRQTVAQIFQSNFQQVDPKYVVEVLAVPWPTFNGLQKQFRLPLFISGWQEDIHDSHNWAQPFLVGDYAHRQSIPDDVIAKFQPLVTAGVTETDPAKRAAIYKQIQDMDYDEVLAVRIYVPTTPFYMQRWVKGFYLNPLYSEEEYYYVLSKD